ncbi:hypothetical protein HF086_001560 [Spodoptera exigua]|uniref:Uncharacterized protein n=1 Tax=Spodoptera exigua TaxID=7107 RepID=A0A922MSI2_SPOEX|nr:hypothetical protein HF086_001560 [Spodoptera exigua]
MRRGFTSLVTSIDSALTRDDTRSDAASTASSDSDRYVVISTSTWRLNNIHIVHQSGGGRSCLRLAADDLKSDECNAIPWDEFQVSSGLDVHT